MTEKDLIKKAIDENVPAKGSEMSAAEVLSVRKRGAKAGGRGFAGAVAVFAVLALAVGSFAAVNGTGLLADTSQPDAKATSAGQGITSKPEMTTTTSLAETTTTTVTEPEPDAPASTTSTVYIPEDEITEGSFQYDYNKPLGIALENAGLSEEGKKGEVTLNCLGILTNKSDECFFKFTYLDKAANDVNTYSYIISTKTYQIVNCSKSSYRLKNIPEDKLYLCYLLKNNSTPDEVHELLGEPDELPNTGVYYEYYNIDEDRKLVINYIDDIITAWIMNIKEQTSVPVLPMTFNLNNDPVTLSRGEEENFLFANSDRMTVSFSNPNIDKDFAAAYQCYVIGNDRNAENAVRADYIQFKDGNIKPALTIPADKLPEQKGAVTMTVRFINDNGDLVVLTGQSLDKGNIYIEMIDAEGEDCATGKVFYFDTDSDIYSDMLDIWRMYYELYGSID